MNYPCANLGSPSMESFMLTLAVFVAAALIGSGLVFIALCDVARAIREAGREKNGRRYGGATCSICQGSGAVMQPPGVNEPINQSSCPSCGGKGYILLWGGERKEGKGDGKA